MSGQKVDSDIKRAYSAYSRAMNYLINGNERRARKELEIVKKQWETRNIGIDIDESIVKMKMEIKRLSYLGLIDTKPIIAKEKDALKTNPYIDTDYPSTRRSVKKTLPKKEIDTTISHSQDTYTFDKQSQLASHELSLNSFTDNEIYAGAIPVAGVISFNNVRYGGYAPNIKVDFSSQLSTIHNKTDRLKSIETCLRDNSIDIPDIENHTPIELIKLIASQIKSDPLLSQEEKETKLETIAKRVTQILLNETDVSNDYLLEADQQIYGRSYGNIGATGGLINSLFANVSMNDAEQAHGTLSTNTMIKAGTADCRGTNATFAALLNAGYQELGSQKEAKILYTKIAYGTTADSFQQHHIEDHNIVLVRDPEKVTVRDAYFDHVDNTPLRQAISGHAGSSKLQKDQNAVGGQREWGFQIAGVPPYPSQQHIKKTTPTHATTPLIMSRPVPSTSTPKSSSTVKIGKRNKP